MTIAPSTSAGPPRLLDRVRHAIRARHYSFRTEKAYVGWIRRFIFFYDKQHPAELGTPEVIRFLEHLATAQRVAASTQNQAFSALLFLYGEVLDRKLTGLEKVARAKRPQRLPVVLSREEVAAVLSRLEGTPHLMASLMYGGGLRLLECAQLRVKDIDLIPFEATSPASVSSTRAIGLPVSAASSYRTPSTASTRARSWNGHGSGSSRRPVSTTTRVAASDADIISTRASCRRRSRMRCACLA